MQQREGSGIEDLELLCLWANKIYLATLSEALPISLAEVTWPRVISYIYIHKRPIVSSCAKPRRKPRDRTPRSLSIPHLRSYSIKLMAKIPTYGSSYELHLASPNGLAPRQKHISRS